MNNTDKSIDHRVLIPTLQISSHHPQRTICCPVKPTDHEIGAALSKLMAEIYGEHHLPDDKIVIHFRGLAGDDFGKSLHSGVTLVIDGIGKNGCQGMQGGRVILLTAPDSPFAKEMSGGIVYLYAPEGSSQQGQALSNEEMQMVHSLLDEHVELTQSSAAKAILKAWPNSADSFIKIASA